MKFELGNNDSEPCVVVTKRDGELVVMFNGFGYEEAQQWFNSKDVMSSLESWHDMMGDYEMAYHQIMFKEFEMSEVEKILNDAQANREMSEVKKTLNYIRTNCEDNLKNCPPVRTSNRVDCMRWGDDVIAVSHAYGNVIFNEDAFEDNRIDCYGYNMTMEKYESVMKDKKIATFVNHWCEEENCNRVLISIVDPLTQSLY